MLLKIEIEELANKYFKEHKVRIDIDVLFAQLMDKNISYSQIEILFQSIIKNINFFMEELNYPMQLSNLFFFEIDARNEPQENCRGSEYRHNLTKRYRQILDSQRTN